MLPEVSTDDYHRGFEWLDVDSFDLVTLRVSLEEALEPVPDETWVGFANLADIVRHYARH